MQSDDLEIADGAAAGAWIKPRLGGEFGAVTLEVPKGFDAYAHVFHPARDREQNSVSWAEVAKACGTTPHREMQWHAILGLRDADELRNSYSPGDSSGVKWAGSDPSIGPMDIETLDALCEVLAAHTPDPTYCFFGLCTIHCWDDRFSPDKLQPLLELPYDRNHIVLAGSLSVIDHIENDWGREAPNLIWPADHSWLAASEVDFDSTLVGGSATLIEAIVDYPQLEAWKVEPTDSLADNADKVNVATRE